MGFFDLLLTLALINWGMSLPLPYKIIFWILWVICGFLNYGILKYSHVKFLQNPKPENPAILQFGRGYFGSNEERGCWIGMIFGTYESILIFLQIFLSQFINLDSRLKLGLCYRVPKNLLLNFYKDGFPLQITDNRSK